MNLLAPTSTELSAAFARGVRQCVIVGVKPLLSDLFSCFRDVPVTLFAVDEQPAPDLPATLVSTEFATETLAAALAKSSFDQLQATLFVWLGDAGYRTFDAVLESLAFMASFPTGSGVLLDYAVERSASSRCAETALGALASTMMTCRGFTQFIQPEAVSTLLRSLGFQRVEHFATDSLSLGSERLVSATI